MTSRDTNIPISKAFLRIQQMERYYDALTEALHNAPKKLLSPSMQKLFQSLSDYLSSGEWLSDYQPDEQNQLPETLKRGVLSQDGLYALLSDASRVLQEYSTDG